MTKTRLQSFVSAIIIVIIIIIIIIVVAIVINRPSDEMISIYFIHLLVG